MEKKTIYKKPILQIAYRKAKAWPFPKLRHIFFQFDPLIEDRKRKFIITVLDDMSTET